MGTPCTIPLATVAGNPLHQQWKKAMDAESDIGMPSDALFHERNRLCRLFSWAVPSDATIDTVVTFAAGAAVHEVAAGSGYWAGMLAAAGLDVVASDVTAPDGNSFLGVATPAYHPVGIADAATAASAAGAAGAVLLLVWPPYASPVAHDALVAFIAAGGTKVAYVGESASGCTADDGFFALWNRSTSVEATYVPIPAWRPVVRDALWLLEFP